MEPLATYRESLLFDRRCRFDLFADSIRARGQTFGGDFDTTTPLARLHPQAERLRVYSSLFRSGAYSCIIGMTAIMALAAGLESHLPTQTFGYAAAITGVGVVFMLAKPRKVEVACFATEAGVRAVAVTRAGKQAGEFEAFVGAVAEQIRRAKSAATHREWGKP